MLKEDLIKCALGGFGSGTRLNDFWFLELSTMTWTQPAMGGTAPSPRQSTALCVANSTQLLLHGGRNHFVLDDLFVYDILVSLDPKTRCKTHYSLVA